ncbi:MAG: HPr(Ser) kinase/phosphatase [Luteitalea sp.]|nr:HPr(Ser) kinase/phosphatase [Luteitalea sp.]
MDALTVRALLELSAGTPLADLTLLAGATGLDHRITHASIQKTGLALAGLHEYLEPGRVLVLDASEIRYLELLPREARQEALARMYAQGLPCVLVTAGLAASDDLRNAADASGVPLLGTLQPTAEVIVTLTAWLDDQLAPSAIVHGVLLDILGLGVFVIGQSGIGKSECALDLVGRGHRLVADDAVEVRRRAESIVIGTCPAPTRNHMEVRGLGIINVRNLFGAGATRPSKRVELIVQLERWDPRSDYERLGLDELTMDLLGIPIPFVRIPVAPGRNIGILVEVAARNQLVRESDRSSARRLVTRLDRALHPGEDPREDDL